MTFVRVIAGDMIKALTVLALVFLSFAHQPVAVAQPDDALAFSVADLSYCGSSPDGDQGGHAPCHACRAGLADLPLPPCVAEPAYAGFARAAFVIADDAPLAQYLFSVRNPRAPPAPI